MAPVEMKLTSKKPSGFYMRAAATFLRGTEEKGPVEELQISALGNAIGAAISIAARIESEKLGSITKIETQYPDMDEEKHGCAQVVIMIKNSAENMKGKDK